MNSMAATLAEALLLLCVEQGNEKARLVLHPVVRVAIRFDNNGELIPAAQPHDS